MDDGGGVRLVALDVDGTVLPADQTIAPSTVEAVAAARAAGVHVVLASSRGPVALEHIQEALGLRHEWFIGYQGALVGRDRSGALEVLDQRLIPPAVARTVETLALAAGLSVGRYFGSLWHVPVMTGAIRHEASTTGEEPIVRTTADGALPAHKIMIIADGDVQTAALTDLARELPDAVTATFSHPCYLEVTAAGVDKGSGIAPLARRLGISLDDIAAVGDGPNDLGLFAAVGHPIAMGQAGPEVQAAAEWVTGAVTDDGVARALEHLGVVGQGSRSSTSTNR